MLTTTVPDTEVEGSAGLRRDAEIHRAVIPSFISINRPQHLHHLKARDRGESINACACECTRMKGGMEKLRDEKESNERSAHARGAFSEQ